MSVTRIIGVDFGTSTSVIRVKRYENGQPLDERLSTKPVVFNMGSTMVPTLIRKTDSDSIYGYNAEVSKKGSFLYQSFKVFLESEDPEQKAKAKELTAEFLRYLAKVYREQSAGGHLGDPTDKEKTIISYPVKWSDETKAFMIESAKAAGFPNVTGMDEANAAIRAVTLQNEDMLRRKGHLTAGSSVNILLLDMGAGTTDLVLCKYYPGEKSEIIHTYPNSGSVLFGGREVDDLLGSYISDKVPDEYRATIIKKLGHENYKIWKETMVSPSLNKYETIEEFSALDNLADVLDFEVEFQLDRPGFESLSAEYLKGLPKLINGCIKEANMSGDKIDLVILTGGHSQWYFVKEIITGKNKEYGSCGLSKIEADSERIVAISLPQETVALGLVFSEMNVKVEQSAKKPEEKPIPAPVPVEERPEEKPSPAEKERSEEPEPAESEQDQGFSLLVEDVFTVTGRGVVVVGQVAGGTVTVGDTVEIVGASGRRKKTTEVCGIEALRTTLLQAKAGDNVGILLKDIQRTDVVRGDMLRASKQTEQTDSLQTGNEGGLVFRDFSSINIFGYANGTSFVFFINGKQAAKLVRGASGYASCKYPAGTYDLVTKVYGWQDPDCLGPCSQTITSRITIKKGKMTNIECRDAFGLSSIKIVVKNPA